MGMRANAYLDYNIAKKEETRALLEVKKAELAVRVAELDYEKALIVKAYQLKRPDEFSEEMIDDEEYKNFMDNQKRKLKDKQKEYEKAVNLFKEAESKFKKSGYEEEK